MKKCTTDYANANRKKTRHTQTANKTTPQKENKRHTHEKRKTNQKQQQQQQQQQQQDKKRNNNTVARPSVSAASLQWTKLVDTQTIDNIAISMLVLKRILPQPPTNQSQTVEGVLRVHNTNEQMNRWLLLVCIGVCIRIGIGICIRIRIRIRILIRIDMDCHGLVVWFLHSAFASFRTPNFLSQSRTASDQQQTSLPLNPHKNTVENKYDILAEY